MYDSLQLEKCWQKYDVHTRQVKEEEEAQKAWDMEEREKRIRRREEFLLVLRKKDEGDYIAVPVDSSSACTCNRVLPGSKTSRSMKVVVI